MMVRTRFAPSPTGDLHVGNARTALFNALYAAGHGGQFVLRIEDTDAERSSAEKEITLLRDLGWLGLRWQEGPDAGGPHGPYRQSERGALYRTYIKKLTDMGMTYPCFCTPAELALARKAQLAAGRPPRYVGTCAHLSAAETAARTAKGLKPALRFRVPGDGQTEFTDLVRGPQRFAHRDIGDFVICRADGSPAFFFSNGLDDALMGITHVLRGEDHLANTPRQLLIMKALDLTAPHYGHLSMVVGQDGQPLSKRHGSASLRDLIAQNYMPLAVMNYMARLGHAYIDMDNKLMSFAELAAQFDMARISHSPAHFDENHLRHWQKLAIANTSDDELWIWMKHGADAAGGTTLESIVPKNKRQLFVQTVRPNVLLSAELKSDYKPQFDVLHWARTLFGDHDFMMKDGLAALSDAGAEYFKKALTGLADNPEYKPFVDALASTTQLRGPDLYKPLRAALTGDTHGPELKQIWELLGQECVRQRLEKAAEIAKG
ncbi:MAG: glutamate--tRNA ligase [Gammaproteobacteria bacterium]|nr:glutamate--tRNA ligase [Gammaproteobacteria bacterium]MDE2345492.1 glutamate--tRNA ligase [Gammaproteobacteria bacterium]